MRETCACEDWPDGCKCDEENEMTHTALPWRIDVAPVSNRLCILSEDAWICGQLTNQPEDFKEGEANAEFIVLACNSHYTLTDEVKRLRKENKKFHEALIHIRDVMKSIKGAREIANITIQRKEYPND